MWDTISPVYEIQSALVSCDRATYLQIQIGARTHNKVIGDRVKQMEYGDVIRDTHEYTYIDNVVIFYQLLRLSALDPFTILAIF